MRLEENALNPIMLSLLKLPVLYSAESTRCISSEKVMDVFRSPRAYGPLDTTPMDDTLLPACACTFLLPSAETMHLCWDLPKAVDALTSWPAKRPFTFSSPFRLPTLFSSCYCLRIHYTCCSICLSENFSNTCCIRELWRGRSLLCIYRTEQGICLNNTFPHTCYTYTPSMMHLQRVQYRALPARCLLRAGGTSAEKDDMLLHCCRKRQTLLPGSADTCKAPATMSARHLLTRTARRSSRTSILW